MRHLSTPKILVGSFAVVILIGTILLCLPAASATGTATPLLDALFTATTSTCVTGLTTVTTAAHWSLFGKIVILLLIQTGGLGAATLPMLILVVLGRRLSLGYSKILGDSFNLDSVVDFPHFFKRAIQGIFLLEILGMLCYLPVFIPDYGIRKGIWFSLFHAVSAFCNAGIDIIGSDSLMPYASHLWMNLVTMALIILGGIGFIVWLDVLQVWRKKKRNLSLHSKIALRMTAFLILAGAVLYLIFEWNNPETMGSMSVGEKLLAALFQSVTTRTAGFAAIPQAGLTINSIIITVVLMFIGGSSVGTAGGVKTGTVAVVLLAVRSTIIGQRDTVAFGRRIPDKTLRKAMSVIALSAVVSVLMVMLLCISENAAARDILFEVYSALGTAGLSRSLTPLLSTFGKVMIILCMFLGRIGPISIAAAMTVRRDSNENLRYVEEDLTVG